MSGSTRIALVLAVALATGSIVSAESPTPPISVSRFDDGERIDLRPEGKLVAWGTPRSGDGSRELLLLSGPSQDDSEPCRDPDAHPLTLWKLSLDGEPRRLVRVADGLPGDTVRIHVFDLNGDGREELLLHRPGELLTLGDDGVQRVLLSPGEFDVHARESETSDLSVEEGQRYVPIAALGSVAFYVADSTGAKLAPASRAELPLQAEMRFGLVRVSTPAVRYLGVDRRGHERFATSPDQVDPRRVRTWLFNPETKATEKCWARFPEPEEMRERRYLMLDGNPVLAMLTMRSDKVTLFGNKRLRLYRLEADRSRMGREPLLALGTKVEQWQDVEIYLVDVDADDRRDLVLGYWKGWNRGKMVLDAYLRLPDGSFRDSPRTTIFPIKEGHRSYLDYGHDLTGDGRRDLLVIGDDRLLVFPGSAKTSKGKRLLEEAPARAVPIRGTLPEWEAVMRERARAERDPKIDVPRIELPRTTVVDLDGDGLAEVLISQQGPGAEESTLSLFRFRSDRP